MKEENHSVPTAIGNMKENAGDRHIQALKELFDERYQKILYIDLTADTFEVIKVGEGEWKKKTEEQPSDKISEWFSWFINGPMCFDLDREILKPFTDLNSLNSVMEKNEFRPFSTVYRRKLDPEDAIYANVSMELFPHLEENGHVTAVLAVRSINQEIQQYSATREEKNSVIVTGKRTLLVVEDNEMNREMLEEILSDEYTILQAENGAVGLELLQKHMMEISVVVLDVQMPVMNGYEFLQHSQSDTFLSKIPVIVATGSNNAEEERICLSLGASDFVSKPYNPEIIKSRIANIIRLKESAATMTILQTEKKTGLFTLQAFYYYAGIAMKKTPEKTYSVTIISVDHFQQMIENYGEEAGNRILTKVGEILKDYTAGADIYGSYSAARFLILRDDLTREETEAWAQNLVVSLENACGTKGIGFKAGIYHDVDQTLSVPMICEHAMTALNSRGWSFDKKYATYDEKHAEAERRLAAMEADMRDAYEKGQFSVYYQPKHDARTGELMGAEALIRWIHPTFGFLSPGEFIPLFESNGFISYADYYVLKRTCQNLRTWLDEGLVTVPISVNASRRDFDHENFVELLMKSVQDNNIDPSLIHVEVTESMFSDRLDEISQILSECREKGFKIELDDFGSGYSSLTTLTILPLDVMKLDMSFMKDYKSEKKRKVLSTCIDLAKNLGLKTVSEGVEYEDQLKLLQEYGCDLIQGYYFSKPLPEKDFREYLLKYSRQD